MTPLAYHVGSLRQRAGTTLAAALGVALVVFVVAATLMLLAGLRQAVAQGGRADRVLVLREGSESELTSQFELPAAERTLAAPGVRAGAIEVVVTMTLARRDGGGVANVVLRGVGPASAALRPELRVVAGRLPAPGTPEVLVGRALGAQLAGTRVGETVELGAGPASVVGVFAAAGSSLESEVWADVELVRAATGRQGLASSVRLVVGDVADVAPVARFVGEDREAGLRAEREDRYLDAQGDRLARFLVGIGTLLAACIVVGAVIGVAVTMHASVARRRRELGTLRALGFTRGEVLAGVLVEAGVVSGAGAALGLGGALLLARARFALVNVASFSELVVELRLTPAVLVGALAVALVAALLGGLVPALRAARLPVAMAVRR